MHEQELIATLVLVKSCVLDISHGHAGLDDKGKHKSQKNIACVAWLRLAFYNVMVKGKARF